MCLNLKFSEDDKYLSKLCENCKNSNIIKKNLLLRYLGFKINIF